VEVKVTNRRETLGYYLLNALHTHTHTHTHIRNWS